MPIRRSRTTTVLSLVAVMIVGVLVALAQQQTATAAGAWTSETIAGMNVRLYTPSTAGQLDGKRALMISLHGCVQTNANLQTGANWAGTADQYGMVVALPAAPNGGVIAGCWDYYDTNHSRSNPGRHDDDLLNLVSALLGRTSLNLDANQVYLSGLSSGGGETMVMGCLAPDIFAGVGINAGPTVGTTSGQISSVATNQSTGTSVCKQFAGSSTAGFTTQLTSVVYGSNDTTVAPGYNTLNGQIMAGIYGAATTSTFSLSGLAGTNTSGSGTLYSDAQGPRVSVIQNTGLGHNWPAGGGSGSSYISTNSINYPAYLASFFFANNRRVSRTGTPTASPTTTATSSPSPSPSASPTSGLFCGSATNLQHKTAGRATSYGVDPYNPYYAKGTLAYLGLGDSTVTTLRETSAGVFAVVTSC
ncbi:MAG: PHB depolymerase family esterase [Hamadaea sp.]|nr:PHB depolymerase family esterase [Hamadaea sp.]NUR52315.1 PHB depolymerase family esterase [Hamadaea sp.]